MDLKNTNHILNLMIIGVDAGALGVSDERLKVGVYRVNLHLLQALAAMDVSNEYRLYSFLPISSEVMHTLGRSMKNIVITPKSGWMQIRLPLELSFRRPDVFLGLSQSMPITSGRRIGFIYDLGFLHTPDAYGRSKHKLEMITKQTVQRSHEIITISETVKEDIVSQYKISREQIHVAYPGVGNVFSRFGLAYKGPFPYILFVGALKHGKNIPMLLTAFAQFLANRRTPYDLILVGGNFWEDSRIDELIRKLGLSDRVQKTGFVSDVSLASYYRGATALVVPSLFEGFCLPAAEAMRSGCPVIGVRAGALPEIMGNTGILVDPKDTDSLARAIGIATTFSTRRSALISAGVQQASSYEWSRMAQIVYNVITANHE